MMRLRRSVLKGLLPLAAALLAIAVVGGGSEGPASFSMTPVNPASGQAVQFAETSAGLTPMGWLWEFGDGQISTSPAPTHVYAAPGSYNVRLHVTTSSGTLETASLLEVSTEHVLRLNAAHSFDVTLLARDQRTGRTGEGKAIPQNDIFGYFAIPALTSNPDNPEVFVKILDGRVINGQFWVFYGGLTDLEYTLTVKENSTGRIKAYRKEPGSACGGFDTAAFGSAPGATPTPTPPPGSVRVVNVGQGGNVFVDTVSGGKQTTIRVGETVQWNWVAGPHSSTSGECRSDPDPYGGESCQESGLWDSGARSVPFQYPRTFTQPGSYTYFCSVHGSSMTGTVVVSP